MVENLKSLPLFDGIWWSTATHLSSNAVRLLIQVGDYLL